MTAPERLLLTLPEVMALTGFSDGKIRRLRERGLMPAPLPLGPGKLVWNRRAILKWLGEIEPEGEAA